MAVTDYLALVQEFHEKNGHPIWTGAVSPNLGGFGNAGLRLTRARLVVEEAAELVTALQEEDPIGLADAIADLLYVTFGAALAFGIPVGPVFEAVHAANLSKDPLNRHGKGGKGPGYTGPEETILKLLNLKS